MDDTLPDAAALRAVSIMQSADLDSPYVRPDGVFGDFDQRVVTTGAEMEPSLL